MGQFYLLKILTTSLSIVVDRNITLQGFFLVEKYNPTSKHLFFQQSQNKYMTGLVKTHHLSQ